MLREESSAPGPDISSAVAETWGDRNLAEREAQSRFERLAGRLEQVGASDEVVRLARKAQADEALHALLCARVAEHYGSPPLATGPLPAPEVAPAALSPRERVLYETVAFCCLAESINSALLTVTLERATVPLVRETVRRILRDEVDHARIGWAHLTAERRAGLGDFLSGWLPSMLRGTVKPELLQPAPPSEYEQALADHGNLSRATRVSILEAALRDVVFPGLEACGVDAAPGHAWLLGALGR